MPEIGKWNFTTREYEPYTLPAGAVRPTGIDFDQPVNCAQCGREVPYGNTYTSRQIHEMTHGFGYPVCVDCFLVERRLDKAAREEEGSSSG